MRFELTTFGSGGQRAIQLRYGDRITPFLIRQKGQKVNKISSSIKFCRDRPSQYDIITPVMKSRKEQSRLHPWIAALLTIVIAQAIVFADRRPGTWSSRGKEQTDWQTGNGSRIKSISYPPEKRPPMAKSRRPQKPEKATDFHRRQPREHRPN